MQYSLNRAVLGLFLGSVIGFLFSFVGSALGTQMGDPNVALGRGFSLQASAAQATDAVINLGVYDGTNWVRLASDGLIGAPQIPVSIGAINAANGLTSFSILGTQQQNVSTCARVPTTNSVVGGTYRRLCLTNQDGSTNAFCSSNSTCTTGNGTRIAGGAEKCFPTSDDVYCISASGTIVMDTQEFYP